MDALDVPVLVVGAGPVGLGLAIDLGVRGVPSVVADMRDGSVSIPKMTSVTARTMEICRRWGIAEEAERVAWPADYPQDFVYVTALTGYELARTPLAPYAAMTERSYTPHGTLHCPQIFFDPVLRRRAQAMPLVDLRYHTELEHFKDDGDAVTAILKNVRSGERTVLRAAYIVGCDGAASTVRATLGIPFLGAGRLSHSLSIFFRSPELARVHDKGWARFYRLIGEDGHWADLVGIDGKELWRLTLLDLAEADLATVDIDGTLRRMAGTAFPYEVISILPWERRDQVAERFGQGRAFIAGDAAHVLSPTGGLGMNTGVADAADLGWKLAAVVSGWAGPHLLESYDAERRPIAHTNVEASTIYFRRLRSVFPSGVPIAEDSQAGTAARAAFAEAFERTKRDDLLYIGEQIRLGYCYENSPICTSDGTQPPTPRGLEYVPTARPGCRAPHVPLEDGGSLLDLFGDGFVLLRFAPLDTAIDPLLSCAAAHGVPLRVHDLHSDEALHIYEQPLVLVRPDGHVAWRGAQVPCDVDALIDHIRGATALRV